MIVDLVVKNNFDSAINYRIKNDMVEALGYDVIPYRSHAIISKLIDP
jgi:hypothetical protein